MLDHLLGISLLVLYIFVWCAECFALSFLLKVHFFLFVKGFVVVVDLFVFEPSDFYQALTPIFNFLFVLKLIY